MPIISIRRSLFHGTAFRLAMLYMALFAASMLIMLTVLYWASAGYLADQTDETIEAEIEGLAEHYGRYGLQGLVDVIAERISRDPAGATIYLLTRPNLDPLIGNIDTWPEVKPVADGWIRFQLSDRGGNSDPRWARARPFLLRGDLRLLVGRDLREQEAMEVLALRALVWGLGTTALLALVGGIMISRSSLSRLEAIQRAFRPIMAGDLSGRVPSRGGRDDVDQIADGINEMLSRIEVLMESVRQVSGNIAHDLRTPLTRLRARLELAIGPTMGDADRQAAIEDAIVEADGLLSTFNALLRIARIEAGEGGTIAPVDLPALLTDVIDLYEPLAQQKNITINADLSPKLVIPGERDLLFQAFTNVLDNAVKYTPPEGRIDVRLAPWKGGAEITIADNGPGIPVGERDKVFRHFYRVETSRSKPGNGLGLSLVAAVARMHRADVRLEDNEPGLRIVIHLPGNEASNPDRTALSAGLLFGEAGVAVSALW